MPALPVTVVSVAPAKGGLYAVVAQWADGTQETVLVPPGLATAEAVSISLVAMAVLAGGPYPADELPHRVHTRYLPRT